MINDECLKAFQCMEEKLVVDSIIIAPNWSKPFKVIRVARGITLTTILGKKGKQFHPIYYARKALNESQKNYTTIEKKFMVVVLTRPKPGHSHV